MSNKNIVFQDSVAIVTNPNPINYHINPADGLILPTVVTFHTGNPEELVSGVSLASLLAICRHRLEALNQGEHACYENEVAIGCCKGALTALEFQKERIERENANKQVTD